MREKDELDHDIEPTPIAGEGEIEIEYSVGSHEIGFDVTDLIDLKCTIAYKFWSIDEESVEVDWKLVGSANYLPSDFPQLIKDYMIDLPELKGQSIYNLKQIN